MVTHDAPGALLASAEMDKLRHQMSIAGPRDGFVSHRTTSGHSFGSLKHYCDDWNLADVDEVSSRPSQSLSLPDPRLHEAAPGMVMHKLSSAQRALDEAKQSAAVSTLQLYIHIPLVPEVWVE